MNQEKIGKYIAIKRKALGMTQSELASKVYVTDKTISRWETGMYMPDLSTIVLLSDILNCSTYELLLGEDMDKTEEKTSNIETETRVLFPLNEEENIIKKLNLVDDLKYKGKFYEKTIQYNHPDKNIDFYSKEIDARFRVRLTKNNNYEKCMISYKRRGEDFFKDKINSEEEVEVEIKYNDFDNLSYLLENVLNMELIESYERYRYVYFNDDVEIDVDIYPFMIAVEIENKSANKDPKAVVLYYLEKLHFSLDDIYQLSWDDKYTELCKEQNVPIYNIVDFTKEMPTFK